MSTFFIACGGTGGHLSPGIAVAERLVARGHRPKLLISQKEVDSRLCRKYRELDFIRVPGAPFSLRPDRALKCATGLTASLAFSYQALKGERPEAVLAFGGFTTAGLVLAAYFLGIPVILHEANRRPGKAVKWLRGLASRLYLPPGVRLSGMHPSVVKYPGYPLRREIRRLPQENARRALGLPVGGKLLVILGGSQGASALNDWVRNNLAALAREGVSVYCVTGIGKGVEGVVEVPVTPHRMGYGWFVPFTDRMAEVLSAADLVISRAGAGSVAEIAHCRVPSILVPFPFAADNHQIENARFLERQGGCVLIEQSRIDGLFQEARDLIFNDWMLERLRTNLGLLYRGDVADWIARDLQALSEDRPAVPLPHFVQPRRT